jgi:hypothetical protein
VSSLVPPASIPAGSVVSLAVPQAAARALPLPLGRFAGGAAAACGPLLAGAAVAVAGRRRRQRRSPFSDAPGDTPPSSSL